MWESFQHAVNLGAVGTGVAWLVTASLLISGFLGCLLPILPGHLILFLAALAHRLMLGREGSGLAWWSFVVLAALMAASQAFEWFSGAAGTRWFGGSRWGALGAFTGSLIGMAFFPYGLVLGPLCGALLAELIFARQHWKTATRSGLGSVVGTLSAVLVKAAVGVLMILWFFLDVFWIR